MAKGVINLQKASGGITKISSADGTGVTELVVPESGNLASVDTAVKDNALARYDGTTGKLQDSGVIVDDSGNVGIRVTPSPAYALYSIPNYTGSAHIGDVCIGKSGANYGSIGYNFRTTNTSYNYLYNVNSMASMIRFDSGGFTFLTAPSGTANNVITFTNAMSLTSSGDLLLTSGTGGIGYGTGAGGTVTQLTSKNTSVTLNKPSGKITTHNAALAANTTVTFTLLNSVITANDTVYCTILRAGTNSSIYRVTTSYGDNGYCNILITNTSASTLSDAVTIKFEVIKGAIS